VIMPPLNPLPRRTLQALIKQHGPALGADPRRCKAFLSDECGDAKLEVNLLTVALDERIPPDLVNATRGTPVALLIEQLVRRLVEHRGLTPQLARWAVDSWALALGIASEAELKAIPQSTLDPTPPETKSEPSLKIPSAPRPMQTAPSSSRVPVRRFTASDAIGLTLRAAALLGPWLLQSFYVARQVLAMWFEMLRTITETRPEDLRRAFETGVLGAGAGALVWGLIGAGVGFGQQALFALSKGGGLESIVWTHVLISATAGAMPGALVGALAAVVRRIGEFGSTVTGSFLGLIIGGFFVPLAAAGFVTGAYVGATIGVLMTFVSLGMLSSKRAHIGLLWDVLGMAGKSLGKMSGWLQLLQGVLVGGSGGAMVWVLIDLGSNLTSGLPMLVGAIVGWVAGAVVGNQYRLFKFL
jgi:hypothetical protein